MAIEQKKLGVPTGETLLGKTVSVNFPSLLSSKYIHFFPSSSFCPKLNKFHVSFSMSFPCFMFASFGQRK